MNKKDIEEDIVVYFNQKGEFLDKDKDIFEADIMDSLGTIKFSDYINQKYGVYLEIDELVELESIENISLHLFNSQEIPVKKDLEYVEFNKEFPLTDVQYSYLIGRNSEFNLGNISTHIYVELTTKYDIEVLNSSLNSLIRKNEMLRTLVRGDKQIVLNTVGNYSIKEFDLTKESEKEQNEKIHKKRNDMIDEIIDVIRWPLFNIESFKINSNERRIFLSFDMMIMDATSIELFVKKWTSEIKGKSNFSEDEKFTFRNYVIEKSRLKKTDKYFSDKEYWLNQLDNFPNYPMIALKKDMEKIIKPTFKRKTDNIAKEQWLKLKKIAKESGVSGTSLLGTLFSRVLELWSGKNRFSISLTINDRYPFNKNVDEIIGDFTTIMPLSVEYYRNRSLGENMVSFNNKLKSNLNHRLYEGTEFFRELNKESQHRISIPIVFTSLLNVDLWGCWEQIGKVNYSQSQTSQVFLDCQVCEANGGLQITWDYVDEAFEKRTINNMFAMYLESLASFAKNGELNENTSLFNNSKLLSYNSTTKEYKLNFLDKLFEKQVILTPNNRAVKFKNEELSYKELNTKAEIVKEKIKTLNIQPGSVIAVMGKRKISSIYNILGILKAGCSYVPIDIGFPSERKNIILKKSNAQILINEDKYVKLVEKNLEADKNNSVGSDLSIKDTAYIIFTSGSTGEPKGVAISHESASNTILDMISKFNISEHDTILGISSLCFDLSVFDIFGSLLSGAALVQIPDQRDLQNIKKVIEEEGITIWNSVPAIMDLLTHGTKKEYESKNEKYFWAPNLNYSNEKYLTDTLKIPFNLTYIFPQFYYLAQKGFLVSDIFKEFPYVNQEALSEFINQLVEEGVLINSLQNIREIFAPQDKLYQKEFDPRIKFDKKKLDKHRKTQTNRKVVNGKASIKLADSVIKPDFVSNRKSIRDFLNQDKIEFNDFSSFIGSFAMNNEVYGYPSSGGLYSIDVYLYIKPNRIELIDGGIYWYNSISNSLEKVSETAIPVTIHYHTNKDIFESSAFSLYFIYNADASFPKYGSEGYFYACLDTGVLLEYATNSAIYNGLDSCIIGKINEKDISRYLYLNKNQIVISSMEFGKSPRKKKLNDYPIVRLNKLVKKDLEEIETGNLRLILLSGDWIPLDLPRRIQKEFPKSLTVSLGGATEGTIWSIYYPITSINDNWESIPYGMPLGNQKMYILDEELFQIPENVQGEIYIGGKGVAKEYVGDTERTSKSFIIHPLYGRLYKTGDYGKFSEDGTIIFIGRKDHQVKIQGYRVELGEIEKNLTDINEIKKAVVIDIVENENIRNLVAYYVSDYQLDLADIKERLSIRLPKYMIPKYINRINKIPLTSNGKIDRKSLPKPKIEKPNIQATDLKSFSNIEIKIKSIWGKYIDISSVDKKANFFDVGGDSIMLMNMYSDIDREFPDVIKMTEIFSYPSISSLAAKIDRNNNVGNKIEFLKNNPISENLSVQSLGIGKEKNYSLSISQNQQQNYLKITKEKNISIESLFSAFAGYALNQITEGNPINIYETNLSGEEYFLKIYDFTEIDSFETLLNIPIKEKIEIENCIFENSISTDEYTVLVSCNKKSCINPDLAKKYDMRLEIFSTTEESTEIIFDTNLFKISDMLASNFMKNLRILIKTYLMSTE